MVDLFNSSKATRKREIIKFKSVNSDEKEQENIDLIEQQKEEMNIMKDEFKELNSRLEEHSKDTDLLRRFYEDGCIDADGNPVDRSSEMR